MTSQDPNNGLYYGFGSGANGWDTDVDLNWEKIGAFLNIMHRPVICGFQ